MLAMMVNRIGLQALAAAVALSCCAASNDVEQAILSFPKISAWELRPDEAVRSANTLISAGRDSACAALEQFAKAKGDFLEGYEADQKVCHLCRLIFLPRIPTDTLRSPRLGAPELLPLHSMNSSDWPYMPFAIADNVPLSMTLGYSSGGRPESAESYIAYCMSNGVFRTQPFPLPSPVTASNALNRVLASSAWKSLKCKDSGQGWSYTLSEGYAKEILWKQVANMANIKEVVP
jgi:hypothetical protein